MSEWVGRGLVGYGSLFLVPGLERASIGEPPGMVM